MRLPNDVELGNRITAKEAAERYGLHARTLWRKIDEGLVPGERIIVGRRCIRLVDPDVLEEYLANRPQCAYPCCEERATIGSLACSGPHARGLEERGKRKSAETCRRMSEGKKGRPRPDVRERVAEMHADPKKRYSWHLRLLEGRSARAATIEPTKIRNAKNRVSGLKGHRPPESERDEEYAAKAQKVIANPNLSERAVARLSKLTRHQVRAIRAGEAARAA